MRHESALQPRPRLVLAAAAGLAAGGALASLAWWLVARLDATAPAEAAARTAQAGSPLPWEALLMGLAVVSAVGLGAALWLTRDARRLLAVARGDEGGDAAAHPHGPRALRAALRAALADLADERDRLRTVLDALGDGVMVLDGALRILSLSPAAARLVQARDTSGGWEGRPLVDVTRAPRLHELADLGRADRVQDEVRLGQPPRAVFVQAAPLRASGGVVLALHDRTEVERLERVRADFVANVSHELRTPLSVLQAHAETLVEIVGEDPTAARRFSERLLARARRLTQLVDDLLELSRVEAGRRSLAHEAVDLRSVVAAALAAAREAATARGVSLDGPAELPPAQIKTNAEARADAGVEAGSETGCLVTWADRGALEQVLANLVDNAVKYASRAVVVRVVARPPSAPGAPARVRLEVHDDGPGVALHERSRVFERFYRCDDPRTAALPGTGLGLAITRHLVQLMEGEIGLEDPPGGTGTLFWVELPAARGPQHGRGRGKMSPS